MRPAWEDGSRRFRPWNRGGILAMLRWLAFPQVFLDLDEPFSSEKKLPMAKEMSVGAEILGRFRRGHITFVPDLSRQISTFEWCFLPTGRPSDAIAKDGSWRFRQRQGRGTNWHYGNVQHFLLHRQVQEESSIATFVLCVSRIRIELSRCTHIFLQCITFGAKMLRVLLFLGWTLMNVARHDKAWYHYKDVCACWESMRLSTLHRLAISSNSIKTYLLQSIW